MKPSPELLLWSAYLPPVDYLLAVSTAPGVMIELGETYAKQSYRNRCEIATSQGRMALSIPVKRPSGNRSPTSEVLIDYDTPWQRIHLGALRAAYARTPFFEHFFPGIEAILRRNHVYLAELNAELLRFLLEAFHIPTPVRYSRGFTPLSEQSHDLRAYFHPKRPRPGGASYVQAFSDRCGFEVNLSAVDLLMNEGRALI